MPLKSPCLSCPFAGGDKNSEHCMSCDDRIAYVRSLSGDDIPSSPLVDEEKPARQKHSGVRTRRTRRNKKKKQEHVWIRNPKQKHVKNADDLCR